MASPHGNVLCVFTMAPSLLRLLLRRLCSCFHLLFIRSHFAHRLVVDDIGDGDVRTGLAEVARRGAPALRRDAVLLAEQRQEDLRLLLTEPGQALESTQ